VPARSHEDAVAATGVLGLVPGGTDACPLEPPVPRGLASSLRATRQRAASVPGDNLCPAVNAPSTRENASLWYHRQDPPAPQIAGETVLVKGYPVVQHLIVSVADVLDRPGEYRDLNLHGHLVGVRNALVELEGPVEARLRLESVVEGVLVSGAVEAPMVFECARCLARRASKVALELCELFVGRGRASSGDADGYCLNGTEMDLEPMLTDAVALALPLQPLCRAECLGLCASCGADLNLGACSCADDVVDPRWAALSVVRERLQH
jgi:uncharacterized protein